ncbi:hypothetical protein GUJ93_ZPchr0010g8605 [Zizania palustris]|uniref:Uncharacterized protein n=1 Tax=Zizania palustris TaxID=103762 RepID=A0A8J5WC50_ZIZPA|nr:hypothetical protein GUJ93_ZPchr0010g8605 [Zizania palustris]
MDNWMQLGRRETDFKDARLGSQSFGDSQGFFVQNFDEAPNRLISFKNQFQDQGSAHHFSEPYFFIPPQPSLTVEASTQMHTESKDLLFRNGHNTMYAKSASPLTLEPPPPSGNSCSPAPPMAVGSAAVGIVSSGHRRGRPWPTVPCCPCSHRTVTTKAAADVDNVVNLKARRLGKSHTDALMQLSLSPQPCENNPDHFFVATQDADIRAKLREVPRVPVIYGLKNSLFIEQPSMQQRKFTQLDEEKRLHMGWFRLHRFVDPSVRVAIELPCTTAKIPRVVASGSAIGTRVQDVTLVPSDNTRRKGGIRGGDSQFLNHVPYMFDLTSRCTLTKVIDWYERAKKWNKGYRFHKVL